MASGIDWFDYPISVDLKWSESCLQTQKVLGCADAFSCI